MKRVGSFSDKKGSERKGSSFGVLVLGWFWFGLVGGGEKKGENLGRERARKFFVSFFERINRRQWKKA